MVGTRKIPCKNCICLGVCKYKTYPDLIMQCETIRNILYDKQNGKSTLVGHRSDDYEKFIYFLSNLFKEEGWVIRILRNSNGEKKLFALSKNELLNYEGYPPIIS